MSRAAAAPQTWNWAHRLQDTPGLPDLRLWGLADPPVKGATAQPSAGMRNATTSATGAAQMRPTPLSDSEAMQMAST